MLVISYTGYRSTEKAIGATNVIDITLNPEISQLSEVVVVGYGTQINPPFRKHCQGEDGEEIQGLP